MAKKHLVATKVKASLAPQDLPDKLYFKIGEVAKLIGVKPYVLRYWETEFPEVAPTKSQSKQRLYRRKEVELILKVRELLYDRRFTIEGARQQIKDLGKEDKEKTQEKQIALPLQNNKLLKENLKSLQKKLQELSEIFAA